jgi:hypothetical protein
MAQLPPVNMSRAFYVILNMYDWAAGGGGGHLLDILFYLTYRRGKKGYQYV